MRGPREIANWSVLLMSGAESKTDAEGQRLADALFRPRSVALVGASASWPSMAMAVRSIRSIPGVMKCRVCARTSR